jgi:hypothetical protein
MEVRFLLGPHMFLDIGVGILGALGFSSLFGTPFTWPLALVGILFALLPDADFVLRWAMRRRIGKVNHRHREFLHYPLLYVSIGSIAVGAATDMQFAFLFAALSLAHFIHDTMGIGWGIAWLYPFSPDFFKAFSERDGRFSRRLLVRWTPAEQNEVERLRGDPDWFRNIYLRMHPISITEFGFFVAAIIAAAMLAR